MSNIQEKYFSMICALFFRTTKSKVCQFLTCVPHLLRSLSKAVRMFSCRSIVKEYKTFQIDTLLVYEVAYDCGWEDRTLKPEPPSSFLRRTTTYFLIKNTRIRLANQMHSERSVNINAGNTACCRMKRNSGEGGNLGRGTTIEKHGSHSVILKRPFNY